MCLYPIASLIELKLFSLVFFFRPLTIEEATDGPLNTKAEYSWINDAPEVIAFHAVSLDSMPPTPTIGKFIMDGLSSLDKVAYVRFASVYKNFKEAKDFEQFVGNLDDKKS